MRTWARFVGRRGRLRCFPKVLVATTLPLFGAGCIVDLVVPPGAEITCASMAECPDGHRCDIVRQRCVAVDENLPPLATVGPVGRSVDLVVVPFTVSDPEASAVAVAFAYCLACDPTQPDAVWHDATPDETSEDLTAIPTDDPTLPHVFVWDAVTDASTGVSALATTTVSTAVDDSGTMTAVRYAPAAILRVIATDANGLAAQPSFSTAFAETTLRRPS